MVNHGEPKISENYSIIHKYKNLLLILTILIITSILIFEEVHSVSNLSFQADIFGGTGLETIEYNTDLSFTNYGGYGTNSHVVRSFLQSGDQIAYGVYKSDPNSFLIEVSPEGFEESTDTLVITNSQYTSGTVEMINSNELHFSWEIIREGYHVILHKNAFLQTDPGLYSGYKFIETFSIENLGENINLFQFVEYLHLDDVAELRDYDGDVQGETLLAINNYSTSGYPIFGKINLRRQSISVNISENEYVGISYQPWKNLLYTGEKLEISRSAYVTSLAKNGTEAEQQVETDALYLLARRHCEIPYFSQKDERWSEESIPCSSDFNTIGKGGCAITASAMLVSAFGEFTTPKELNACLGNYACPLYWDAVVNQCSNDLLKGKNRIKWDNENSEYMWQILDTLLHLDNQPVILGLYRYVLNEENKWEKHTHFVLVVSGEGHDPENYRINDPDYDCGANIKLSQISDMWEFEWIIEYLPERLCSSINIIPPDCIGQISSAVPVEFGDGTSTSNSETSNSQEINNVRSIIGDVNIFTLHEENMYVSLHAESTTNNVTQIRVWSDSHPNTNWQGFSTLVYLPISEYVYVEFKDELGNISDVYSTTPYPNDPPSMIYQILFPMIEN